MQHKQGNAEERPDDCCGIDGEPAGNNCLPVSISPECLNG